MTVFWQTHSVFQADTLSSLEDVISQSSGAMDDVRHKLQSKEHLIADLEQRLQQQSTSGTLHLSPRFSLLLNSKPSPLRDILLVGPHGRLQRDNHKASPAATIAKPVDRRLTANTSADASPTARDLAPSPHVEYKAKPAVERSHVCKHRKACPETNLSFMDPVAASTMIGQSMFEMSVSEQNSNQTRAGPVPGKGLLFGGRTTKLPFGKYVSPERQRNASASAISVVSELTEEEDPLSGGGIPLSAYMSETQGSTGRNPLSRTDEKDEKPSEEVDRTTGKANENQSKVSIKVTLNTQHQKPKDLPFEHPLIPVTSPKYMDVFKEQLIQRKLGQSSKKPGSLCSSSSSCSFENQSKVAALVGVFEFGAMASRSCAAKRPRALRSKKRTSPTTQKRALVARTNKAYNLRMKHRLKSAANHTCSSNDSKEKSDGFEAYTCE